MLKPPLSKIRKHVRDRPYMSGIERDKLRTKQTAEVFTPTPLVQEILDQLPPELFKDPTKTFCDPSCGDGQFLSEVLIRKLENGIDFETALSTIYGVDIMEDNVALCRDRLLCGMEEYRHIVHRNIVCADSLKYDFSFELNGDGTNKVVYPGPVEMPEMFCGEKVEKIKKASTIKHQTMEVDGFTENEGAVGKVLEKFNPPFDQPNTLLADYIRFGPDLDQQ